MGKADGDEVRVGAYIARDRLHEAATEAAEAARRSAWERGETEQEADAAADRAWLAVWEPIAALISAGEAASLGERRWN